MCMWGRGGGREEGDGGALQDIGTTGGMGLCAGSVTRHRIR